ncbi:MAG: DUF481 domain-containing protein [Akkermansiaceae bacterium]
MMNNKKILNSLAVVVALTASSQGEEWKNSFDLGATLTKGNSDSLLLTMGFTTEKKEKENEYRGDLFYTYGEETDTTTNDELLGSGAWRHLYSDRFYAGPRFDFRRDDVADIQYRAALTGVVGYYVVKEEQTTLSLEGGLGFTFEEQGSVTNDYAHAYVGEFFEHKLNDKTKIYQSFTMVLPTDDTGDYQFVVEAGLETTLTDSLSLKVFAQDQYDAQPATGKDENDFKLITGISYKF